MLDFYSLPSVHFSHPLCSPSPSPILLYSTISCFYCLPVCYQLPQLFLSLTFSCFYSDLTSLSGPLCFPRCAWAPISTLLFESQGRTCVCVFNNEDILIDLYRWLIFCLCVHGFFCIYKRNLFEICKVALQTSLPLQLQARSITACTVHTLPFFLSLCPLSSLIPSLSFNPPPPLHML